MFSVSFEEPSHQRCEFQIYPIQAILMYEANLNVAYILQYVCNHDYHNQTHFY